MTYCLLIPHYNHVRQFERFLPRLTRLGLPLLVVDDGSEAGQRARLRALLAEVPGACLVECARNGGKGAALKVGLRAAAERGFTHAFQIDADGQHNAEDVPRFMAVSRAKPAAIVCGRPVFDDSAPRVRRIGRRITDFWVALETWSLAIKDGLCGFRIYPVATALALCERNRIGEGMDMDTEILVRAVWEDVELIFIDTQVSYLPDGASHFHYLRDNLRLVALHTRLVLGMVPRIPKLARRALRNT